MSIGERGAPRLGPDSDVLGRLKRRQGHRSLKLALPSSELLVGR